MSSIISFFKVVENENKGFKIEENLLAGVAENGIVIDGDGLNADLSSTIQYYYNLGWTEKLSAVNIALDKAIDSLDSEKITELEAEKDRLKAICQALDINTYGEKSSYDFVNRLGLAILNSRKFRISREAELYKALRYTGNGDNIKVADLSEARKDITEILNGIFDIKGCTYLKPIQVKLNLEEVAKLIAIANNTRTRWTSKGIRTKVSKTIATEVAIQAILFVCKNCFKMVIPVATKADKREEV